jgi:TDG/mug DNA glycosylase family protein
LSQPNAAPVSTGAVLPDVLRPGLAVVFCGTAAGAASARRGAYYAGPGNSFWRALHEAGLTPRRLSPADFPTLPDHGIGLTDLNKTEFGQDVDLTPAAFDVAGLAAKVEAHRPARLAFTSKTAAAIALGTTTGKLPLGRQAEAWHGAEVWVLPSPSGQARRFWDMAPWRALGERVGAGDATGRAT